MTKVEISLPCLVSYLLIVKTVLWFKSNYETIWYKNFHPISIISVVVQEKMPKIQTFILRANEKGNLN